MVPEEMSVNEDIDYIKITYFFKYENVEYFKFVYKDIDYYVIYILNDSEVQQSSPIIRISSYITNSNNEEKVYSVEVTNVPNVKMMWITTGDYNDIDYNVIKIGEIEVILDYSSVIVIGKKNISTSPVDIQIDEFKKLEAEIGDDTCSFTFTIWEDQTSPVDIQLGKKEVFKKLAEIEDQVKKFKNQLTYKMKIQGSKCLSFNSDSKIVQIANAGESLFQDNFSSATVEVISITSVGEINGIFQCKQCGEKVMPCQGNLQQCTVCRMTQLSDSVTLFLAEPYLFLTLFQDQLDNIIKIYNEENNGNNCLVTLTDTALKKILLCVSNVKIHYDKNTKIITDIQKM